MSDLTTVDKVKQYLRINHQQDDLLIKRIITSSSDFIKTYTLRDILASNKVDKFTGFGNNFYLLKNYPINSIISITIDNNILNSNSYDFDDCEVYLKGYNFSRNRLSNIIVYNAGYTECPYDLEQSVIELCGFKYKQMEHLDLKNKIIAQETVGFIVEEIPKFIKVVLDRYKRVY